MHSYFLPLKRNIPFLCNPFFFGVVLRFSIKGRAAAAKEAALPYSI